MRHSPGSPSGLEPSGVIPIERALRAALVGSLLSLCIAGCVAPRAAEPANTVTAPLVDTSGRVDARPGQVTGTPASPGVHALGLGGARDGLLYVPKSYRPDQPAPLMLVLHGSRGNAGQMLQVMQSLAESEGILLLIPESRGLTWDDKMGKHGEDLAFIDRALTHVFSRHLVARERISVAGFSAGGSYALALGILNGDLFSRILAFAPGFVHADEPRGMPRIFVAHGDKDLVLPVEGSGRRIVAELRSAGFAVHYHEFSGGHSIPEDVVQAAVQWLREAPPPVSGP
ncbi:alpha/beta hydrolase [Myxococcus landrumensis]|uniref:Phospholipase n=1 Tax=Myxococcus landrumensis TaxID=2813577 RepID=A0ABX7ND35_9BACT|nr:PHB depolymerase family esterase [Myxococcus landrumus]QSQ14228.1 phospholipase [Myxococcus landrumus]